VHARPLLGLKLLVLGGRKTAIRQRHQPRRLAGLSGSRLHAHENRVSVPGFVVDFCDVVERVGTAAVVGCKDGLRIELVLV